MLEDEDDRGGLHNMNMNTSRLCNPLGHIVSTLAFGAPRSQLGLLVHVLDALLLLSQ